MTFIDQIGNKIELSKTPKRIVSLVPSQTELLHDLGLQHEVVGITKFCVHPGEWFRSKTRVGGTKTFHFDIINGLEPDLIICNKEENEEAQVKQLMQHYPVWVSDVRNLYDALEMINALGGISGFAGKAQAIADGISTQFDKLRPQSSKRTAYFIWCNPYMAAGQNTFINDMLERCGLENVFSSLGEHYPEVNEQMLKESNPELILLSSEPFPFKEKHIKVVKQICPTAKIKLVDGEMFSWYGSRLLKAPTYFTEILNYKL